MPKRISAKIAYEDDIIEVTFRGKRSVMNGFVRAALNLALPGCYKGESEPPE